LKKAVDASVKLPTFRAAPFKPMNEADQAGRARHNRGK
jgi:hypothetical protein